MSNVSIPITQDGFNRLKKELNHLEQDERPKVVEAIQQARALGDLSENAEYKAARERQGVVDSRISYLRRRIPLLKVLQASEDHSVIRFGATVTLVDLDKDKNSTYTLVGEDESDPDQGKISISSPLGKSLLGKLADNIFEVRTPGGVKEYEIKEIN